MKGLKLMEIYRNETVAMFVKSITKQYNTNNLFPINSPRRREW